MLDQSRQELQSASPTELRVAETLARRFLSAQLEEDLIPADEANRVVDEHKGVNDEVWSRALHAALLGLRAVQQCGFRFTETET